MLLLASGLPTGRSRVAAPAAMAQQHSALTMEPAGGPCITVASALSLCMGHNVFLSSSLREKKKSLPPSVTRLGSKGKGLKIISALAVMDSSSAARGGKGSLHWEGGCHTGEITLINQTNDLLAG